MTFSLHEIARSLGGRVIGKTVRCPGPGHSRFDDSLAVALATNADGFTVHSHAGDPWDLCKDYVRERLGLEQFGTGPRRELTAEEKEARRLESEAAAAAEADDRRQRKTWAAEIWKASEPLRGSIAERYLLDRLCGFALPDAVYGGDALRWNPNVRRFHSEPVPGAVGAMIARMSDPLTNAGTGVHRTFLDAQAGKLGRGMLGDKGVCRLWPDDAVTIGLNVGEGIETALSAVALFDAAPMWAALDAGNLAALPVLGGVECLTIFSDNDPEKLGRRAGPAAAKACADRWLAAEREVITRTPREAEADFNDMHRNLSGKGLAA